MKNQDFFSNEFENVNENFLSFDNDMYADDWSNADDSDADGDYEIAGDVYANAGVASKKTSTPYIVILTNTNSVSAVANVVFLGASNAMIQGSAGNYGVTAGITPTYGIANISYAEFLSSLLTTPTKIGTTMIEASSQAQVMQTIQINVKNVRGSFSGETFTPQINPNQYQSTILEMPNQFILNQWTTLTISSVEKSGWVKFSMYPLVEASTIGGLTGKKSHSFANPKISGLRLQK